jgi:prolipoprotein diacylglyceryltransferase
MKRYFQKEGIKQETLDNLLIYTVLSTIVGARLGHVFFYDWAYYRLNISEIFMPWKGGLASHGAAVIIPLVLYYFAKKNLKTIQHNFLWLMDRVVICVALAGSLIRIGNYTNSEIYGDPVNHPTETVFFRPVLDYFDSYFSNIIDASKFNPTGEYLVSDSLNLPEYELIITPKPGVSIGTIQSVLELQMVPMFNSQNKDSRHLYIPKNSYFSPIGNNSYAISIYGIPRFPTQLFEAAGYLLIFIILFLLGENNHLTHRGRIFGLFLILVFGFRIGIEFLKANQKSFEATMNLNMGQILSIPLVLTGLYLLINSLRTNIRN